MSETVARRIVPGAPPPAPLTKSQRKKRKAKKTAESTPDSPETVIEATSNVIAEQAPEVEEAREVSTTVAPEPALEEEVLKPSPIAELLQKRLKATSKKITRILTYAATDPEKLNDDQKRTLKNLPALEALQKELGEVKKAVETYESELAREMSAKRAEAEKAERIRIADAIAATKDSSTKMFSQVLGLLRLRSLLAAGHHESFPESGVVFVAGDILLGDDADIKRTVLSGLLSGEGELEGISYSHLLEVMEAQLHPRVPTPVVEHPVEEVAPVADDPAPVAGVPAVPTTGSFHFMQESELEATSFEDGAEWVERPGAAEHQAEPEAAPANVSQPLEVEQEVPNGQVEVAQPPPVSATIDWAADEDAGLPPIESLHARFGTSGSITPAPEASEPEALPAAQANGHVEAPASSTRQEDDGFTQTRGARGNRGRGHRDGERGGHRGFRGGFRGGDRGGFRGDRGHRGGFRGGDRGGFRGGRGEWRGGDGEFRGRGRGRGRGGDRGVAPPAAPAMTA